MSPLSVSFDFTRFVQAFTSSGERGLLDMAMHCYETTLISHPGFATVSVDMFLQNLGATAWKTYASSKDVAMLEMTIIVCNEILKLRPEGHKCHVASLINLAVSLECSYDNQHYNVGRLDEAITMLRRAVELSSLGGSCTARFMAMGQLGSALDVCYKHQRDVNSLAEAVVWHRGALQLCPLEYPQRCRFINSLAAALMTQFEQLGNMDSFVETIVLHRQALELRPVGHPHRPCSLNNLAAMLGERFKQLGELDLLTETIDLRRQVLDLRPLGHPSHLSSLNNLAVALMTRFEKVDDMDSFAEALALHRQALDLHPVGHSDRSTSLNNLANALARRYEHLGEVDSLAETLDLHRQALDLRPPGHPNRSISLYSLASALVIRFRQFGELDSLQEAVDLHRQALDLRPLGHCQRSASLHNLATTLTTRFRRLGDIDSLEEALILLRQALDLRPVGHPHRPCSLTSLANVLVTRFEQLGGLCSLAEAIDMRRQVLDIRPQGHPGRSSSLNNLAMSLVTRFEQLGDLCSLGEAIDLHRQAVNLCPLRSPDRARSLHNLAIALICQFEQSGGLNLLTEAIDLHRQDLDLLPLGHCERPDSLCGLTYALSKRYEQLGDLNSLSEAFLLHRQALHLCRPGHPNRFHFLSGIAGCMLQKVPHTFDFIGGIRHIREALQENVTPVRIRLRNMTSLLRTVETAYQSMTGGTGSDYDDMVLQMYMLTIRLLPRAASFGHDHITRLQELSLDESLSRNAAARAIIMKREEEAVEMLEEGRGVFWAQAVRLRGIQLDLLPPEDAQELKGLLQNLEAGSVRDDTLTLVQQDRQAGKRRLQSEAADAIIADIRSRPGMERFLMPPAFNSLAQSLPVGFVILLNISELGQHALIMDGSTKSVSSVSLKLPVRMSGSKLRAVQQKSSRDAASTEVDVSNAEFPVTVKQGEEPRASGVRERVIRTFEDSLADLWSFIVKPIIDVLQLKRSHGRDRPRVWWCATGNLTFLPIHAAGGYSLAASESSGVGNECASDYMVSSYAPSILSLVRARSTSSTLPRNKVVGLAVHEGSPMRGPDVPTLLKVKDEVRRVKEHFEAAGATLTVINDTSAHPTVDGVLASLQGSDVNILHLSCHGVQKKDPLASAFLLRDGDLTIQELMKLDLKHASLTFLSACQTAKGSQDQPDQAVHLAASMLFCGFKSVIATMWSMADSDGPIVASSVYEMLFKEETFDINDVPYALDDAVRLLREKEQKVNAERWAVFMHMGA